jgi:cation transport regulator ChaC
MKYFAYGSNMDQDRMKQRNIRFSKREHAILKGYRLEFNKIASGNEGYANIVKDTNGIVEGILYEIEEEDIRKLDRYEGCPNHYYRITVNVELDNGQIVEASTYIANQSMIKEGLKPRKSYLEHLLKGCDLLSKEYCEMLKKVETLD